MVAEEEKKKKAEENTEPVKKNTFKGEGEALPVQSVPEGSVALLDAIAAISSPLETTRVAQVAARQIVLFSDADCCTISRWDQDDNLVTLWAEYYRGDDRALPVAHLPYPASDYPSTEKVLKSATPVRLNINDPGLHEGERILMKSIGAKALLMLPLISQEKTIGLIEVFETGSGQDFSAEEIANIRVLAEHAGISLERARLLEEAKQHAAELEIIRQASIKLTASLELSQVFNAILLSALQLSPDALDAHIFTLQDNKLEFGASLWADGRKGPSYKTVREGGLTDRVAKSGKALPIERVETHPLYINSTWIKDGWKGSIIGIPLKIGEEVVGVMNIAYRARQEFTEDRLRMLGLLSDQAAIAIHNARLHDFVKHQAITDPLTGVANRRAFNDQLEEEIRRSKRYGHAFSLLILDLDGFKAVNDTFGHLIGDRTLQMVAECLQNTIRSTDFLSRYGGDEFALILPETDRKQAKNLVEKINMSVSECHMPWPEGENVSRIKVSSGIASFPLDAETADYLITLADTELYRKKHKGA